MIDETDTMAPSKTAARGGGGKAAVIIEPEWLDQNQLAAYLHVSRMSIWRMRRELAGFPQFHKVLGRGYVRKREIDEFILNAPAT